MGLGLGLIRVRVGLANQGARLTAAKKKFENFESLRNRRQPGPPVSNPNPNFFFPNPQLVP